MGDLFENASKVGTSEPTTNTEVITTATTPEKVEPEGKIFVYEGAPTDFPIKEDLAELLTQAVKRTTGFAHDLWGLNIAVPAAVLESLNDEKLKDGKIPEGYVTEENVDDCRELRKKLNKLWEDTENERKAMKKIVTAPYDHLNDGYQDATYLLRLAKDTLTTQITKVENEEKARKKDGIKHIILDKAKDYRTDLPEYLEKYDALMGRVFQDCMLNKSQSDTKSQQMIMEGLRAIAADLAVVDGYKDPAEREAIKNNFLESGNLTAAIEKRQRYQANMDFLAELDRKAAERDREEQQAKAQAQTATQPTVAPRPTVVRTAPAPQPQTGKIQLTQVAPTSIEKYFHIWHDGPNAEEAFRALTQFLKDNGFHRENMKQIYIDYLNM